MMRGMRVGVVWLFGCAACGRLGFPIAPATDGDAALLDGEVEVIDAAPADAAPADAAPGHDATGATDSMMTMVDASPAGVTAVHLSVAEGDFLDRGAFSMAPTSVTTGISSSWWRFTG